VYFAYGIPNKAEVLATEARREKILFSASLLKMIGSALKSLQSNSRRVILKVQGVQESKYSAVYNSSL